jgi:hypothetical protein
MHYRSHYSIRYLPIPLLRKAKDNTAHGCTARQVDSGQVAAGSTIVCCDLKGERVLMLTCSAGEAPPPPHIRALCYASPAGMAAAVATATIVNRSYWVVNRCLDVLCSQLKRGKKAVDKGWAASASLTQEGAQG